MLGCLRGHARANQREACIKASAGTAVCLDSDMFWPIRVELLRMEVQDWLSWLQAKHETCWKHWSCLGLRRLRESGALSLSLDCWNPSSWSFCCIESFTLVETWTLLEICTKGGPLLGPNLCHEHDRPPRNPCWGLIYHILLFHTKWSVLLFY